MSAEIRRPRDAREREAALVAAASVLAAATNDLGLCEPVEPPRGELEHMHYFCGNTEIPTDLQEREPQRAARCAGAGGRVPGQDPPEDHAKLPARSGVTATRVNARSAAGPMP